jgi:virulence factor Mce-like protein
LLIATVAAVTYYAFTRQLPFSHPFTLHALVSDSVNLRPGSPVRIAGVYVGSVRGVAPAGNASEVSFTLSSSGQPVHDDATVRIRTRLFLEGSYYLELEPGTPGAPILHDGATIPESRTSSPVQAYEVLSTFNTATRSNLQQLLETLKQGLTTRAISSLKATAPQLTPVLKDLAWVTQSLRGTEPGDVQTLLQSASSVAVTLARSAPQLADLVTGLDRASTALVDTDGALAGSITGLDETLRTAPAALTALDAALPPVTGLAVALRPSLKLAPPILAHLSATVGQLAAVVAEPERGRVLNALSATFEQFPALLRELATTFVPTEPVTQCLRTHVTPVLDAEVPDGALSTGRPAWQDFVHFLPGIAGASGDFDANGPYTRVLAALGTNTLSLGGLGKPPLLGSLVGTAPPGGTSILGARPAWVGDLTSADFRPDVPCTTQPVPSLASPTAAADMRATHAPASTPLRRAALQRLVTRGETRIRQAAGR